MLKHRLCTGTHNNRAGLASLISIRPNSSPVDLSLGPCSPGVLVLFLVLDEAGVAVPSGAVGTPKTTISQSSRL
jgi:hypothetical protein